MEDRQQLRVAANEVRFREMNDRIRDAVDTMDPDASQRLGMLCECAIADCEEMIELTPEQYGRVRSESRWFVVRPEHVVEEVEHPVEQHDAYWVVEKHGIAGDYAEAASDAAADDA